MTDYQLGEQAYIRGEPYDGSRSEEWRRGYKTAEEDDYNKQAYGRFEDDYNPLDFGD